MADEYTLPELNGFDLSSLMAPSAAPAAPAPFRPTMQGQGPQGKNLMSQLAPLFAILPAIMKGGAGHVGAAAFLQGLQQARQQTQQAGQQQFQNNRLTQQDQATEQYRQQQLDAQQQQRRDAFRQKVLTATQGIETPEGARALLDFMGGEGAQLGIPRSQVEAYVMETATPIKLIEKHVRKVVAATKPELMDTWHQQRASILVNGKPVPYDVWSQFVTSAVDASGKPIVMAPKPEKPDVPNTSEEQTLQRYAEEHGYASWAKVPYAEQLKVKAQVGAAGRAPERPPAPTGGEKPLTQNQRANVIQARRNQWQRFTKAVLDRQASTAKIDAGLAALDRGNRNAATQTIIIAFNKLNDETSVVREGEYARSEALVPLVNRIEGALQRITEGGASMKDSDLRALATEAKSIAQGLQAVSTEAAANLRQSITEEMGDYGIPTSRVFGGSTIGVHGQAPPAPTAGGTDRYQRYLDSKKGAK